MTGYVSLKHGNHIDNNICFYAFLPEIVGKRSHLSDEWNVRASLHADSWLTEGIVFDVIYLPCVVHCLKPKR